MPTDERPLRDVLREVEEADKSATPGPWTWDPATESENYRDNDGVLQYRETPLNDETYKSLAPEVIEYAGCGTHLIAVGDADARMIALARIALPRLASELRALAPLLREAAKELARHMHPNDRILIDRMTAKADELEAP